MSVKIKITRQTIRFGVSEIVRSLRYAVGSIPRALATAVASGIAFLIYIVFSFPRFYLELFLSGNWEYALRIFLWDFVFTGDYFSLALILVYSVLSGVMLVVLVRQFRFHGTTNARSAFGALPGFIVAGCASCGAGLLGLIGAFGAVSLFPFAGDGVRILGIALILFVLSRTGDPQECRINPTQLASNK